jgi:hypothetical protein
MKNRWQEKNKGQVLVIVTLMLIGLVAMLALVLDGGMNYTNRRAAQLAADAGALAGARAYCLTVNDSPGTATIAAATAASQYVALNDANLVNVSVEAGSGDVTVDTSITYDTFFLGILGRAQMTAPASATAGCTPPTEGFGVMPIAWSCEPPDLIPDDEDPILDCDLLTMDSFEDPGDGQCTPGEDPVYIVVDSEEVNEEIVCLDPDEPYPPEDPEDVDYVYCDLDGNGENDVRLISGGNKSWLDLDGGGGGVAELFDWIENGLDGSINIHTWFQGQSGVADSVYKSIHEHQLHRDVIIPVFNLVCQGDPRNEENDCIYHDGDDSVIGGEIEGFAYYHVISFALFRVECVDAGGGTVGKEGCPARNLLEETLDLGPQTKTVEGCFIEGFDSNLGGGAGPIDTGAVVVYLKH